MTEDYTQALRNYQNSRGLGVNALQPVPVAGPETAIMKALMGYLAGKGMTGAQSQMKQADTQDTDDRNLALQRAMGAYRGDTPYEADTFPGEEPLQGNYNMGTGQNRMALAESLGASKYKDLQAAGLGTLLQEPSTVEPPEAPTIKPFATGESDAQGNPMFQDRAFNPQTQTWFNMGSPYPKRGGVTVNTGNQVDPFELKYGKQESGMMKNPNFDESRPVTRENAPYTPTPLGSKDPQTTNITKGQQFLDTADKMTSQLDTYANVLQRTGTKVAPGAEQMELKGAYAALQLEYKELAKLGVLAGPDMALIESVMQDPTTLKGAALEAFGGMEGYMRQLNLVRNKLIAARLSARKNLMGEKVFENPTADEYKEIKMGDWYYWDGEPTQKGAKAE